ncbi:helix-turn-helix domain-containing protein [Roseibium suaedae]|uniref:Transcriptional regulator, AraC family n=1 Tax=Roseibium suaedae TaxID=735517 RepID=A0A1M6ZTA8_9HYPH|nr:helix-turn-helix domain-containing protein [Roseibium suaedae]SHL33712.1 transcriptional regulator, AraC family [Roseibium suaedae]
MASSGDNLHSNLAAAGNFQLADASEQAALQPWIPMECLQLGAGSDIGQLERIDLKHQHIVRETQAVAVQKMGVLPPGLATLSCCTPDPGFRFSEHGSESDDTVFFMAEGTEFDLRVPHAVQTAYISFNQLEFLRDARLVNPRNWDNPPKGIHPLKMGRKPQLRAAIGLLFKALDAAKTCNLQPKPNVLAHAIHQTLLDVAAVTTAFPEQIQFPALRSRSLQICRQARTYAEAELDAGDLPTTAGICGAVRVCERTLQYAFRDYAGMTPTAYLRLLRLNRVRAILSKAEADGTTVTEVAMRFGFLHLGRFAQDYKKVFGESPSATLSS